MVTTIEMEQLICESLNIKSTSASQGADLAKDRDLGRGNEPEYGNLW